MTDRHTSEVGRNCFVSRRRTQVTDSGDDERKLLVDNDDYAVIMTERRAASAAVKDAKCWTTMSTYRADAIVRTCYMRATGR